MSVDPNTPVIVGVGQVTNRPGADGGGLDSRPEPIGLMVQAVQAAMEDCDGAEPGGSCPGRPPAGGPAPSRSGCPTR